MPSYDYYCEANGEVVEVSHAMGERLNTWGEVCARAGRDLGSTPADAEVKKLIPGSSVIRSEALRNPDLPPCQTGAPCCGAKACGL